MSEDNNSWKDIAIGITLSAALMGGLYALVNYNPTRTHKSISISQESAGKETPFARTEKVNYALGKGCSSQMIMENGKWVGMQWSLNQSVYQRWSDCDSLEISIKEVGYSTSLSLQQPGITLTTRFSQPQKQRTLTYIVTGIDSMTGSKKILAQETVFPNSK